ncbi:MAG: dTDP-4-dehydrorhamnose reductase, partial [Actinobacteria bacterium]|nr:dTDP-4-dehydrorhamnose reductase [Actinomycetota bacterium]NIS33024.1 dTDP-4-dehydrorhamnose reductase [Actinomycetota bacterium]NIU67951.1 dTDP-4-dehydrorhamnose reductase [Actinomycetota bacterium]NIV88285.1 dTDP-4-dehydrorhamnose reductase [Actinomycetota bacterium]NIW29745.1 dTDP-4-dehydrorhamnose reductase [Actinomycetota bacterium]
DTLDIRDPHAVDRLVTAWQPDVVVNCAAYTAVDRAEEEEEEAREINATAVGGLAAACNRVGAALVHVSTDYVFAGDASRPYREDDPVSPRSAYGRTKLQGEESARRADRHLIVRTAWLYGRGGHNFVEAIRTQIEGGSERLRVVADQTGCPTFCDDLAGAVLALVDVGARGLVHAVNSGHTTWHGFAEEIVRTLGVDLVVEPVPTSAFPRPAPRPAFSVLDTSHLTQLVGHPMPPWQDALHRYLETT